LGLDDGISGEGGRESKRVSDDKVHASAAAADAAGGTWSSSSSSFERGARRNPSSSEAAVVKKERYGDPNTQVKGSIKALSRKEGQDTEEKKRIKQYQRPRQRRLSNVTREYTPTTLQPKKQPPKKQPLTSSESDDSCPEMDRIYNTPPRSSSDSTHRKHNQQQQPPPTQQRPKHLPPPLPPQAPPQAPPRPLDISTNSNNSIMDDYIQLKLKVAELQSDLQHFQAETSKYKLKLFKMQKENEELKHENKTLLQQQGSNGGGGGAAFGGSSSDSELKKENDFMKRVLYNLERLGKIDKVDELLKSRLDDVDVEEKKRGSGFNSSNNNNNNERRDNVVDGNNIGTSNNVNVGNRRPMLRKAHSSRTTRRCWGEELDWGNSDSSSSKPQPPQANNNGPQRRGSILFRRLSMPFAPPSASNDDDVVEVEEHPMTDAAVNNTRIRRRSFSHGSLSSLFRWPTEENQDTSSNEATVRLDDLGRIQCQQPQPRPSFGEAIKNIQRSFSSNPNMRDNNGQSAAKAAAAKVHPNDKDDGDKKDVPEYVHTDEEANLLQVSEISSDIVPSSRIPAMGGGTSSNFNVDIRQTAKQASTRPTNRGNRDRGLFGSFIREIIREES